MCKSKHAVDHPAGLGGFLSCLIAALAAGGAWGALIDSLNGGIDDPIGDGALNGVIVGAVFFLLLTCVVAAWQVLGDVKTSRWNKRRVGARHRKAASKRRKQERRDRQNWKRELQKRATEPPV
ncbi:hypothetical protein ACQEU6_06175 [Spirillospora sp. CA-108201]